MRRSDRRSAPPADCGKYLPTVARFVALAALLAGAGAGTTGCDGDGGTSQPTWNEAFDASAAGSLSGVWGSGPDDVWIVGGDDSRGIIWHYDGAAWAEHEAPPLPLLVWVFGFGPNDVWVVGLGGGAARWNGTAWTVLDTGTTEDLWGIWGTSADDLWIVGGDTNDPSKFTGPVMLHWDGSAFERYVLDDAENPRDVDALFKVWGIDGRLLAVGQHGMVLEWDGSAWKRVSAGANGDQDFVSLWGTSADHVVLVGGRGNARVATSNGAAFETLKPPQLGGLNAVHMVRPEEAIVGGIIGFVGRFDVASGKIIAESDALTPVDIHAIWGDGQGRHYAVGGSFRAPHRGAALMRTAP